MEFEFIQMIEFMLAISMVLVTSLVFGFLLLAVGCFVFLLFMSPWILLAWFSWWLIRLMMKSKNQNDNKD